MIAMRKFFVLVASLLMALMVSAASWAVDPLPSTDATPSESPTPVLTDAPSPSPEPQLIHTIVSAPDLVNSDIGDTTIRAGRGWEPGDPNSINDDYRAATSKVFGLLASYKADSVLVAGDLVEGHWGLDVDNTGIFGPVETYSQRFVAVSNAGNLYYSEWKRFFKNAGVSFADIYPAVGDHDIGDDPWPAQYFKYQAFEEFKDVWARNFTTNFDNGWRFSTRPVGTPFEKTSYGVYLHPRVFLLTVDVFAKWADGVHANVCCGYLDWIDSTLAKVPDDVITIVQGHTPVLGPVRSVGSSKLMLEGGSTSNFWKTLQRHNVDFYFAGEVHANTVIQDADKDVVQISHGGLFSWSGTKYLVAKIYDNGRVSIDTYTNAGVLYSNVTKLWQTGSHRPPGQILYPEQPTNSGHLEYLDGTLLVRTGDTEPYTELVAGATIFEKK